MNEIPVCVSLNKIDDNRIQCELRRKFIINKKSNDFLVWKKIFSNSINGKSVKIEFIIAFRDKLLSAINLEELGLIENDLIIKKTRERFFFKAKE
jgi:hypothetical protein